MLVNEVIGRMDDDTTDARADCRVVTERTIPFGGAAYGNICATHLESTDCYDRGGCVLRITLKNEGSAFLPFAKNIDGGIEVHMAGDLEARAFLAALRLLLVSDLRGLTEDCQES